MNFLKETKIKIKETGHSFEDIMFIGSSNGEYRINWEKFKKIADFNYDDGYGSSKIATDLILYFKDKTYMTRGEYDGSEWWEYLVPKLFNENDKYKDFDIIGGNEYMWETLKEMNEKKDEEEF